MTTPAKQLKKDRSTGGAARLWALAALLLAVFWGSFFLGRYGVSLTLGQFLGLMAEGLQRVLTALVNWVGKPFGFAAERLFAVPVTWPSVMETIVLNIRMPRIIMASGGLLPGFRRCMLPGRFPEPDGGPRSAGCFHRCLLWRGTGHSAWAFLRYDHPVRFLFQPAYGAAGLCDRSACPGAENC